MQSTENEIWKPIDGYNGRYEVSNLGRVKNLAYLNTIGHLVAGRIKKPAADSWGYLQASLTIDGKTRLSLVHHLVMEAFVGPRPTGMQVCHNNGQATDNRLDNLRYDTGSSNTFDTVKHGTHPQVRRTHCKRGHNLVRPNLLESALKENRRSCLACHRARHRSYSTGQDFDQAYSDACYEAIMNV